MSFRKRDLIDYGCCSYLPMRVWAGIPEPFGVGELNSIEFLFHANSEKLEAIFKDIYIPVDELQSDGETQTSYYNIGMDENAIRDNFVADFGELPLMRPYYPESNDGNKYSLRKILAVFKAVLEENEYKYRRLAATLGFTYNPIENYNMSEEGKDTETPTGTETHSHTVDISKTSFYEANGPLTEITSSSPDASGFKSLDFTMALTQDVGYEEKSVSDIEAGQKASLNGDPSINGGQNPTTKNYTTTMDSERDGRLESYQETTGDTAQAQNIAGSREQIAMGHIRVGSDSPSFTDTTTYTNKKTDKEHEFSRNGNIGVTTTQQMIDQERQVVRYSLIREFYEDLVERICLQTWN